MMIVKKEIYYDGWRIVTSCDTAKSQSWKEGDPLYIATVEAELRDESEYRAGWKAKKPFAIPERGHLVFHSLDAAHDALLKEATELIDSLKAS